MMNKLDDYCFVPSNDDDEVLAVRVLSGPYSGTVFSLKKVQIKEDSEGLYFDCDLVYELVMENGEPNPSADVEKLNKVSIDAIVSDVISKAIKSSNQQIGE